MGPELEQFAQRNKYQENKEPKEEKVGYNPWEPVPGLQGGGNEYSCIKHQININMTDAVL